MLLECEFGGPAHEFPDDWHLAGANKLDPRADPRWRPTTYEYYDAKLNIVHVAQEYLCDDEAIDKFTDVASFGPDFNPTHVSARRPDGTIEMLKVKYDRANDLVVDF